MSTIKAGYRITVTSWENDADHYNTEIVDGLTEDTVRFHVDLLKLISKSNCNHKQYFGNMYEPGERELAAFEMAVSKVLVKHDRLDDKHEVLDIAMDVIGNYTGYGDEGFYTRVAESIAVEYVPQEIIIEDVSKKFGV